MLPVQKCSELNQHLEFCLLFFEKVVGFSVRAGVWFQILSGICKDVNLPFTGKGLISKDYIHIVPRKPAKIRKLKEIKPVVHCDINVPSKWQTYHRISRHINVFTNGRLFIPPAKIIIPKFSLSDWDIVLATIGEKVFPLGGVRKLFTMNGHLLGDSKDLQDNHFYVAAGLETFKYFPYWKSPRVPSEVQQKYANVEKKSQRKKKVDSKGKEPCHYDGIPPKTQDSVYYAKEEKKKALAEPLVQRGAEGDVYKAPTPSKETQGALDVKEDRNVQLEVPVDQRQSEIVKEDEEIHENTPDFEGNKVSSFYFVFNGLDLRHLTR
uniref:Doublecortin domain containing 2C n=1 Tax=Rhinopithecus roxellana TaxID=61622 RepID=A0A2K6QW10_RHIRO